MSCTLNILTDLDRSVSDEDEFVGNLEILAKFVFCFLLAIPKFERLR